MPKILTNPKTKRSVIYTPNPLPPKKKSGKKAYV